jgi:hypothetical protein
MLQDVAKLNRWERKMVSHSKILAFSWGEEKLLEFSAKK